MWVQSGGERGVSVYSALAQHVESFSLIFPRTRSVKPKKETFLLVANLWDVDDLAQKGTLLQQLGRMGL